MPTAKLKNAIRQYSQIALLYPQQINLNSLGGTRPTLLRFDVQKQTQSQWCWAATAASISKYYNPTSRWTQCLVATNVLNKNSCCISPITCNIPWYLNHALSITDNFISIHSALTFNEVELELINSRVVGARVEWIGGGGHFMVIYGCKTVNGINYYNIDDPIYGKSEIAEINFLTAYQGAGSWTHSYITKS